MISKNKLSKIGLGTWGIGGFMEATNNDNEYEKQINSLIYSFGKEINYFETVYMYAQGKTIDLLAQALKKSNINREKVFITLSIYEQDASTVEEIEDRINDFLKVFEINYIDSVQFAMSFVNKIGIQKIKELVEKLISTGKIRFTSLTNSNLEFLKEYHQIFGDKLFAHENVFNFEIRENEKMGITEYAKQNNILNVIFQPLRRNRTANRNWPLLVELANKYNKTQNQIILNWITLKGFFPIVKSSTIAHIDENLASFDFQIEQTDLDKLNNFEVPNYTTPKIDWDETGDGVTIYQLPNKFDELCPKNE